jgi:molybdopterin converting factor small subunit
MEIHVQFFGQLRDAAGASDLDLELSAGSTVGDLLAAVYERVPALRNWNESILIGAGVEFVGRTHALQPNEQIALMPPVQGG